MDVCPNAKNGFQNGFEIREVDDGELHEKTAIARHATALEDTGM